MIAIKEDIESDLSKSIYLFDGKNTAFFTIGNDELNCSDLESFLELMLFKINNVLLDVKKSKHDGIFQCCSPDSIVDKIVPLTKEEQRKQTTMEVIITRRIGQELEKFNAKRDNELSVIKQKAINEAMVLEVMSKEKADIPAKEIKKWSFRRYIARLIYPE